ncbi:BrxA family protein, partial [Flavihumibacter fluminis]
MSDSRGATSKRKFQEMIRRLQQFSVEELDLLADGNPEQQKQLCLLGFARYYRFFYDFVTEVMLEKTMV